MEQKFIYILFKIAVIILLASSSINAQNPNWQAPNSSNFAFTANVFAIFNVDDVRSNHVNDRIAFFVGNELRGLSKPISTGNGLFVHVVTLYANVAKQDMTMKVFKHSNLTVYDIAGSFQFLTQSRTGKIDAPFLINAYQDNISPINVLPIPTQSSLFGIPYAPLHLNDYLVRPDSSLITWSFAPNPFLIVSLVGGILHVSGQNDLQGQETTLAVTATDVHGQTSLVPIVFELFNDFLGPEWTTIPNQSIAADSQFVDFNLDDFENVYQGSNLMYDYRPIVEESSDPDPNPLWAHNGSYRNTMTITARVQYTPKYIFEHEDDVLIALVNENIRGLARKDAQSGLYYITVGGAVNGAKIKFKFYSGEMKEVLTWVDSLTYRSYGILGYTDFPTVMDFAPLLPTILPNGETSISIVDTLWRGLMTFEFVAKDTIYPAYKHDEQLASFCIVNDIMELDTLYQDADGDGLGNPLVFIQACLGTAGFVTNNTDCNDNSAVDPLLVVSLTETSGMANNDGFICAGSAVTLSASGGQSYNWSTGQTTATIIVTPTVTTTYTVLMTSITGCQSALDTTIYVEGQVVNQSGNDGFGSLRQVFNCIQEGSIITFNQPSINISNLTSPLTFNKNVTIKGNNPNSRPVIRFDFLNSINGMSVSNTKTLNLDNVDMLISNNNSSKPTVSGKGHVKILSKTVIKNN